MFEDFLKYIEDNHLFNRQDHILLGVSGGMDSMVMAHLFMKAGFNAGIAHCNFALRSAESEKDEELVRIYAVENNMPFFHIMFKTRDYAREHGISVQMAARNLRYKWFEEIRQMHGYKYIAVAHNLNDNIETLLINLTRGTGLTGLTGMRPSGNKVIRPLLFAPRQRINDYCITSKVRFREDKSNDETKYTRNKIRHQVIPVLREINPSIEATLNETATRLSGIDEIVAEFIDSLRKKISKEEGDSVVFPVNELLPRLSNLSILFELFRPYGITGSLTRDLVNIVNGQTGGFVLTRTHRLIKNREELIVSPLVKNSSATFLARDVIGLTDIPYIISAEIIESMPDTGFTENRNIAFLDFDEVKFPLIIRPWNKGDFFYPLGMKDKKKLSDYFIDRKYSVIKKEKALVLESDGKIVWLLGERIDNRFSITRSTSRILRIEVAGW